MILRVDARSATAQGSRKHVPCCHTSAHGSGACCFVYGPRELLVLWSSSVAVIGWRNLFSGWTSAGPADVRYPCILFYNELSRRDNKGIELSRRCSIDSNREQVKRTQMIVKRNVSEQMVLTVRISCPGTWSGSLLIVSPMHEEMSFKIDVSRDQESRSRSSRRSARSRSLKSHSDHCAWSKISSDGMSGEELICVRKMVIFGCVQTVRRGRRRGLIFPQVMVMLVEAVRTIPVDMQVPKFRRNRRRR